MVLKYYLQPNPVTPDPNDQSARVLSGNVLNFEDIVTEARRRGTTLTETDLRAAGNLLFETVCHAVAQGNSVNLPLANFRGSITGVFTNATDSFDPSRHTVRAVISQGTMMAEHMASATLEKVLQSQPSPTLIEYFDVNTQTANSKLTPNGIGQISGEELKFDPANAAEGIFIVSSSGTATKVVVIASRTEGKLVFSIPAGLAAGNYTLEVRRGYGNAATIRTGTLTDTVHVI
jgi:hypothetical protein